LKPSQVGKAGVEALLIRTLQRASIGYISSMLKTRLMNGVLWLGILAVLIVIFVVLRPFLFNMVSPPRINSTPVILQQVQTLSQLVTVKYVMEKVVVISDPQPGLREFFIPGSTENRVVILAHGVVLAGVNLEEIKESDLHPDGKKISIRLPPSRIVAKFLDDKQTKVLEVRTGLLRRFDKDLEQNARDQAVDEIMRAARDGGILKDADDRARTQFTNLLRLLGFEDVEFVAP
jgi:hypothetical protein